MKALEDFPLPTVVSHPSSVFQDDKPNIRLPYFFIKKRDNLEYVVHDKIYKKAS